MAGGYQEKLFTLRQSGVKYSLEPMHRLIESLGHPERDLSFIHIAGTNGKGSVAAMCAAIAGAAGLKTGLYTSPHLVSYRERFQIDGRPIPEARLEEYLAFFESKGWPGTFFEISTAVALLYFQQERADLVIWETGLGGRLDATNVVQPRISVLTPVGLDHTHILGTTLAEVAAEKAEIIKSGVSAVSAPQDPDVLEVFLAKAARMGSALIVVDPKEGLETSLAGEHQRINAATAARAMQEAIPGISEQAIRQGLGSVRWPGRCDRLPTSPPIVLDGAHNVQAVDALVRAAPALLGRGPIHLVFGAARDKDIEGMAQRLRELPGLERTTVVNLPHERGAAAEVLTAYFPGATPAQNWAEAWAMVREAEMPALVTGSLFLVGEVLRDLSQPSRRLDPGELWTVGR